MYVYFMIDDEFPLLPDEAAVSKSRPLPEGIYNVPRNFLLDEALYDEPPPELITAAPHARGLYDVPRALLGKIIITTVCIHRLVLFYAFIILFYFFLIDLLTVFPFCLSNC